MVSTGRARLAGLTLGERWSGWNREPFTCESRAHISVWEMQAQFFLARWLQPGQQHGRRLPSVSSVCVRSTRRSLVARCFADSTQQIHSLRASGVMSLHASRAGTSAVNASCRSAGRLCTVPDGTRSPATSKWYGVSPLSGGRQTPAGAPGRGAVDRLRARDQHGPVAAELEADYLVVGAGAAGMAFTDALVDQADVSVIMVDRRHGVGGHWLSAYPFVRLHQASSFYGVASTLLGDNRIQADGPEAGLHERASAPEICAYYARVSARAPALVRPGFLLSQLRLSRRRSIRLARVRAGLSGTRPAAGRRRPLPLPDDPGVHPSAVRRL